MIKVRFAPSPTGFLHLGSARTALFNWLFARKNNGKFLLRVEDTDQVRSKKEFLDEILEDMKWLGLDWDEEPVNQSDRFDLYREKAEQILNEGKAYKEGEAIIFKVEKGRDVVIDDMIHGEITFNTDQIKDQVMLKSDGSPAYNFCCVVDDSEMEITHIIRGDDHISNTPKQMIFYEALGKTPPKFGHMPLMMGTDGAKLSKRHGGVSVEEYKKEGFLPEAMMNYLMFLGWSPKCEKEILSLEDAIELFDIKDMTGVQSKFDIQKLRWMNGEYLMNAKSSDLIPVIKEQLVKLNIPEDKIDDGYLEKILDQYKMRGKTGQEIATLIDCFFIDEYEYDEKGKRKFLDKEDNKENIKIFADRLEKIEDYSKESIETVCREIAEERDLKAKGIIHPTRMAISGKTQGCGLFEMMELLGQEKVVSRILRNV